MDIETIRTRLKTQGWKIREIPIRKQDTIVRWKLIATKGEKSYDVGGTTLQDAMEMLGKTLGAIAWKAE